MLLRQNRNMVILKFISPSNSNSKLKDIKELPLDTLWAELQEQRLVPLKQMMGWDSLGLYCTCFLGLILKS